MSIVLYFFQGELGESIDSPNAFVVLQYILFILVLTFTSRSSRLVPLSYLNFKHPFLSNKEIFIFDFKLKIKLLAMFGR